MKSKSRQSLVRLGVLLTAALLGQTSCGTPCPHSCPAKWILVNRLAVTAAMNGGAVTGVQATLTGPATVVLSCQAQDNGTAASCTWPSGPVIAGSYSLELTAPGFQSMNLSTTVTGVSDPQCGCDSATMQPSAVTLNPF